MSQLFDKNYNEIKISDTQRYRMLGNGWTVDVICHLLNSLINRQNVIPSLFDLDS